MTTPRRYVSPGEIIPPGYGLAYHAYDRDLSVCYPVPLNLAVRWARDAWYWLRIGLARRSPTPTDRALYDAYQRGVVEGLAQRANRTRVEVELALERGRMEGERQFASRALAELEAERVQRREKHAS